jgi:hypothetical protein
MLRRKPGLFSRTSDTYLLHFSQTRAGSRSTGVMRPSAVTPQLKERRADQGGTIQ